MADRRIQDLDAATSVQGSDLFVLSQSNAAKKLTGSVLEQWLLDIVDGHGGISSISKTSTSGLVDTYTITYADGDTTTFNVTNGKSIASVTKTATSGLVDTYTITYNDSTTSTFTITNGAKGDTGTSAYLWIKWSSVANPTAQDMTDNPDRFIGVCSTSSSTAPTTPNSYKWYNWKGLTGDTGKGIVSVQKTSTSGLVDTYTITYTDNSTSIYTVTNGKDGENISSIVKTATAGLVDTYTITLTGGSTTNFNVTNGNSIVTITQTAGSHQAGTFDTYTITYLDGTVSTFDVYNGANGEGTVSTVNGIQSVGDNVETMVVMTTDPTSLTVGATNLLWLNKTNGKIYVCTGNAGSSYNWEKISDGGYSIELELNSTTYELVAKLYDGNHSLVSTSSTIDLPIEQLVVSITFDSATNELVITLKNGTTTRVPIGTIVSGLATQTWVTTNYATQSSVANAIANEHTHSNKSVLDGITSNDIDSWDGKQDVIPDLNNIRSGATLGLTAIQPSHEIISQLSVVNGAINITFEEV